MEDYFKETDYDGEIYEHFMKRTLQPGDELYSKDGSLLGTFFSFCEKYVGRLDNPGIKPGRYVDRSKLIVSSDLGLLGTSIEHTTTECVLDATKYDEYYQSLSEDWKLIDYSEDFVADLPNTTFIEGDVVRLTDEEHEHYSEDLSKNQFTLYRIYYKSAESDDIPTDYRLRAGPLQFDANETQLKAAAQGISPIRIFDGGQAVRFASMQSEAEFYLLIGEYSRVFNQAAGSYKWDVADAEQMVNLGKAHAIYKKGDYNWLVTFNDNDIGRQVASANLILET